MKKSYLFLATAILALASCSDNTYLGEQEGPNGSGGAILFESNMPQITRSSSTDAEKLNYSFKVFGIKTLSDNSEQRVFATASSGVTPYWVWFVDNTANSTTSNSGNWEYVGTSGQQYGTIDGGSDDYRVELGADQTIKYWDTSASKYDFQAWSDVNAKPSVTPSVTVSAISKEGMTIAATPAQLANFYISDLQSGASNSFTNSVVNFTFRKAATKVRLGIYETVPGYHVRNLKFMYTNSGEQTSQKTGDVNPHAILDGKFVGNSSDRKTFTVTYETTSPHKAILTPSDENSTNTTFFDFGEFIVGDNVYLGEAANAATWANTSATDHYTAVFPNTTTSNIADMTLKISYELYNELSQEVIAVNNKTAIVPAAYMTWKPNYAYTYLFKITDDELFPITLDAVVIEDAEGKQETITTVTEPSITTYAKASAVTTDNEYKKNNDIYVTVMDGTTNPALTVGTNAELYSVTIDAGALQKITETTVANAVANGSWDATASTFTVTDAASKNMVVTKSNSLLSAITAIPADASPTGAAITINGAKFNPTSAGTYVFRYMKGVPTYDTGTVLANGTSLHGYYTESSGVYTQCNSTDTADGSTTYYKISTPGVYQYKVIVVVN